MKHYIQPSTQFSLVESMMSLCEASGTKNTVVSFPNRYTEMNTEGM